MNLEPTLARAVREARRAEGVSQRELARRSGIAASQISRIEAGEIKRPAATTTEAIAQALGRHVYLLAWLAGNASSDEVLWALNHRDPDLDVSSPVTDEMLPLLSEKAFEHFVGDTWADEWLDGADDSLRRLVSLWPGLTEERRDLLVRFADDQLTLSEIDRRRKQAEVEGA